MSLSNIMVLFFAVYLAIGLQKSYLFISTELPEIFNEVLDEGEDDELIQARNQLYDAFHALDKIVGTKGVTILVFSFGMLFWLPMWLYLIYKRLYSK